MAGLDTQEQNKEQKRPYDWLNGYKFVKGQSGNPGGRKKGSKSLKTFVREYLEALPDTEKIKILQQLPAEVIWKMGEGNPQNDLMSGGKPISELEPDRKAVVADMLIKYLNGNTRDANGK